MRSDVYAKMYFPGVACCHIEMTKMHGSAKGDKL